jgi:N utilization substance protein B
MSSAPPIPTSGRNPHVTPRQKAREIAFQFLFRYDHDGFNNAAAPSQVFDEFTKHAEHFDCPPESFDFAARLAETTIKQLTMIDEMITKYAENWRLERIGAVDKSILRMGIAELLFFKDVPISVTLNEVIELSKDFGEAETPAFINGILDPISREPLALAGKVPSTS